MVCLGDIRKNTLYKEDKDDDDDDNNNNNNDNNIEVSFLDKETLFFLYLCEFIYISTS